MPKDRRIHPEPAEGSGDVPVTYADSSALERDFGFVHPELVEGHRKSLYEKASANLPNGTRNIIHPELAEGSIEINLRKQTDNDTTRNVRSKK